MNKKKILAKNSLKSVFRAWVGYYRMKCGKSFSAPVTKVLFHVGRDEEMTFS